MWSGDGEFMAGFRVPKQTGCHAIKTRLWLTCLAVLPIPGHHSGLSSLAGSSGPQTVLVDLGDTMLRYLLSLGWMSPSPRDRRGANELSGQWAGLRDGKEGSWFL